MPSHCNKGLSWGGLISSGNAQSFGSLATQWPKDLREIDRDVRERGRLISGYGALHLESDLDVAPRFDRLQKQIYRM
jgi:hypothetical protein